MEAQRSSPVEVAGLVQGNLRFAAKLHRHGVRTSLPSPSRPFYVMVTTDFAFGDKIRPDAIAFSYHVTRLESSLKFRGREGVFGGRRVQGGGRL